MKYVEGYMGFVLHLDGTFPDQLAYGNNNIKKICK